LTATIENLVGRVNDAAATTVGAGQDLLRRAEVAPLEVVQHQREIAQYQRCRAGPRRSHGAKSSAHAVEIKQRQCPLKSVLSDGDSPLLQGPIETVSSGCNCACSSRGRSRVQRPGRRKRNGDDEGKR
jgi:hypothetical protein